MGLFENVAELGRWIEHFLVESWVDRQHERLTKAAAEIQARAEAFHRETGHAWPLACSVGRLMPVEPWQPNTPEAFAQGKSIARPHSSREQVAFGCAGG